MEFMDKPEVYNRFSDIMMACNATDIRKVIHEVSSLFKGHSELIQVGPREFSCTHIGPISLQYEDAMYA